MVANFTYYADKHCLLLDIIHIEKLINSIEVSLCVKNGCSFILDDKKREHRFI